MPAMHVFLDGDHERASVEAGAYTMPVFRTTEDWTVDALEGAMQSGRTALRVLIPAWIGTQHVLIEAVTSLQSWMMTTAVLRGKFEDEVEQPGWAVLSPAARAVITPRYMEAIRRAIPQATEEQALQAVEMILDGAAADAPPNVRPPGDPA